MKYFTFESFRNRENFSPLISSSFSKIKLSKKSFDKLKQWAHFPDVMVTCSCDLYLTFYCTPPVQLECSKTIYFPQSFH